MKWILPLMCVASALAQRPTVSTVRTTATANGCTVTWTTSSPSDSLVDLGTGMGPWTPSWFTSEANTQDKTGVTTHSYTLNSLMPGSADNVYIRSRPVTNGVVDLSPQDSGWYDGASGCQTGDTCTCNVPPVAATVGNSYNFAFWMPTLVTVMQGGETYVPIFYSDISRPSPYTDSPLIVPFAGLPNEHGETYSLYDAGNGFVLTDPSGNGIARFNSYRTSRKDVALRIGTTASTVVGAYVVTIGPVYSSSYPQVTHTYSFILNVVPNTFVKGTPASYPPIPGIGSATTPHTWLWGMITKGQADCNTASGYVSGNFYDAIRAFQQVKTYDLANLNTGTNWDACIAKRETDYLTGAGGIVPANGGIFEIYEASEGLANLAIAGDSAAQSALALNDAKSQWSSTRPLLLDVGLQRELAFDTELHINANRAGITTNAAKIPIGISMMLAQIDQILNGQVSHEMFVDGLMADVLIHYYISNGSSDARIPQAIKSLADHDWVNYWIPGLCSGGGSVTFKGCFAYSAGMVHLGIDASTNGSPSNGANLNMVMAPMYAWLFSMTGNASIPGSDGSQCGGTVGQPCTYQQAADAIFLSGVQQSDYYSPIKDWNLNFRWSFDYVTWRSQP